MYDGDYSIVLANDSLNQRVIGKLVLEGSVTQDHLRPLLKALKKKGLQPQIISRDGSPLYPELLKEIWPDALQQDCHFHLTQHVTKEGLKEFQTERNKIEIPKMKRGKASTAKELGKRQKTKEMKKQKSELFKNRYLTVKREYSENDSEIWNRLILILPVIAIIRKCILDFYTLMESSDEKTFDARLNLWLNNDYYQKACPKVLDVLGKHRNINWVKSHLVFINAQRTSNDVERSNRRIRHRLMVHEHFRKLETLDNGVTLDILDDDSKPKQGYLKLQRNKEIA